MTRTELQQVRATLDTLIDIAAGEGAWNCANGGGESLAILDAELAKPEVAREWGVQYNDVEAGLVDTEIYRNTEREARVIAANDPRRKLFTRTEAHLVPAGPWERAE